MKRFICFLVALECSATFAQDPTVPSAQILERLRREPTVTSPMEVAQEQRASPVLKLKAIVMTDSDHGTALIEVDGRRIRLQLSRADTGSASLVIQGSTYRVQNFTARSVLLENQERTLLVQ